MGREGLAGQDESRNAIEVIDRCVLENEVMSMSNFILAQIKPTPATEAILSLMTKLVAC